MSGSNFAQFIPLILIFVIFYFFLIRPQQKRVKDHKEMVKNLKRGDEVITSGGIYCKISRVIDESKIEVEIANNTKNTINKEGGIKTKRPNEAGNAVEEYVKKSINLQNNYKVLDFKGQGYPDIKFKDEFNKTNYLEIKTTGGETDKKYEENLKSTFRAFYTSPSKNHKVTENSHHFLIGFRVKLNPDKKYEIVSYKIVDLFNLEIDIKYEIQASNKKIYTKENIIYES